MANHAGSGKPRTERPGRVRGRADVAVLVVPPDAATEQTLREAMRREGWQVAAAGQEAACAVVVWSEHSVDSDELAAAARPYLDRGKLLQVLWQPPRWNYGQLNHIEAPDPFCFYNSLVIDHHAILTANLAAAHPQTGCRHRGALALLPADARILDPMAELIVDNEDLIVHLTLGEKIWGFHGDIRVRLSSIVFVAPVPKPWLGLRGWRMAGVSFAGHAALGTRRHGDGYDFCILHRDRPAVQVDMASGRFSRLVIGVPEGGDPEAEAARIAAAAGITPSAPAQALHRQTSSAAAVRIGTDVSLEVRAPLFRAGQALAGRSASRR